MKLPTTNKHKLIFFIGLTLVILISVIGFVNKPLSRIEIPIYAVRDSSAGNIATNDENDANSAYQRLLQFIICQELDTSAIPAYFITDNVRDYVYQSFIDFYKSRNCQPAWNNITGPLPIADSLIAVLQSATEEGLRYNYHLEELIEAKRAVTESLAGTTWPDSVQLAQVAHSDFLMTGSYLTYASHLLSGKVGPDQFDITWRAHPRKRNLAPILQKAISSNTITGSLEKVKPGHPQYDLMKEALMCYQSIEAAGGWPTLPRYANLSLGDEGELVYLLKQRLSLTQDLSPAVAQHTAHFFNKAVEDAVKHFQRRNGLKADGVAGKNTIDLLNIPVEKRIEKIRINLERLRWLPDTLGGHYVMVNIPEFKAYVVENGQRIMNMKVVVGREYASTPIFRDEITYIVFSPTWTVPLSIAREEILPNIKRDSTYLTRYNYRLYQSWQSDSTLLDPTQIKWKNIRPENFNYRLVKQPGPGNPLGRIKFMFPNDLAIYLHDTPAEHLFDKKTRAYSHGCVRVEKPVELALHLLKDVPEINQDNIYDFMNQAEPKVVSLPESVPIHLLYLTAFVDKNGILNFRKDIYGHDTLQIEAI